MNEAFLAYSADLARIAADEAIELVFLAERIAHFAPGSIDRSREIHEARETFENFAARRQAAFDALSDALQEIPS